MDIGKLKVLVVDDSSQFLKVMKETLESKNCEVTCTTKSSEVVPTLINESFHLVFLDCVLHKEKGIEIVEKIQKVLGNSIQIVVMSGIVQEQSLSGYICKGVFEFLSKPVSDKELEIILRNVRAKYIYGDEKNLILKLFKSNVSSVEALKLLVSLDSAKAHEFFFYISYALSSKENLSLDWKLNDKKHRLLISNKSIIDYERESADSFFEHAVSKSYMDSKKAQEIKKQLYGKDNYADHLLSECILSPSQISNLKYDMLIQAFKEITPDSKVSLDFQIFKSEKQLIPVLDQNEYGDLIFLLFKRNFNSQLSSFFDDELMNRSLVFQDTGHVYLFEDKTFIDDLKSGIKLKGLYKNTKDKNLFQLHILYLLLKGGVYVSGQNMSVKNHYLIERYKSLESFIDKSKKKSDVFLKMHPFPARELTQAEIKECYNNFLKKNHPDSIGYNMPKDLIDQIEKTLHALKKAYEIETDPLLKMKMSEEKKKKVVEEAILLNTKSKIIQRYLAEGNYEKAFSLIKTITDKEFSEDLELQIIYLWLYFKAKDKFELSKSRSVQYMKNIQVNKSTLQTNKLLHYVFGLYYVNKEQYERAIRSFDNSKKLDPSFTPSYEDAKKCSVMKSANTTNTQSFTIKGLKDSFFKKKDTTQSGYFTKTKTLFGKKKKVS